MASFHTAALTLTLSQRERGLRQRRGMALLMVLLLLSLTLGLSYAAMRSQSTVGMIQRNSDRGASARQAAITGLTMARKKMHRNDWAGVNTSLNGSLNTNESFLATYTAGDATLSASDGDQPYRVTLLLHRLCGRSQPTGEHRHLPGAGGGSPHSAKAGPATVRLGQHAGIHPLSNRYARHGTRHSLPVHGTCPIPEETQDCQELSEQRQCPVAVHIRPERHAACRPARLPAFQRSGLLAFQRRKRRRTLSCSRPVWA